jgi:hypothetical protein
MNRFVRAERAPNPPPFDQIRGERGNGAPAKPISRNTRSAVRARRTGFTHVVERALARPAFQPIDVGRAVAIGLR